LGRDLTPYRVPFSPSVREHRWTSTSALDQIARASVKQIAWKHGTRRGRASATARAYALENLTKN